MKRRKLLCILLTFVLLFAIVPLAAFAAEDEVTVNLVDGEDIYFYLIEETVGSNPELVLYVKSGNGAGVKCTGTVNLVGNNVTIPKIHGGRDVGINNVTISGSNIIISDGITASEGWGADYWANGNSGPTVNNLTIAADNVTINGGINGGKGGDALGFPGIGGAISNLTLSGNNITINGGINAGNGGNGNSVSGSGGIVSGITISGNNVTINGGINPGEPGATLNQKGAAGTVSDVQIPASRDCAALTYGADSATAGTPTILTADTDITETISGQEYIHVLRFPNAPIGITAAGCTTLDQNDGKITGVNSTMEYKLATDTEWTAITSDTVTGLKNGTYDVRIAATDTAPASPAITVTVDTFVPVPDTGDRHDMVLPILLLFFSGMGMVTVLVSGKKRG